MTVQTDQPSVISEERVYARSVHTPYAVRRFARSQLLVWGLSPLVDTAELIASELATNAVTHGAGDVVGVRLECNGVSVCIRVWDGNPDPPAIGIPDADDEAGRGLMITDALAGRWGSYRVATGGKVVFAVIAGELALPGTEPGARPKAERNVMITTQHPPRELISPDLFERLAERVQEDEDTDEETACRIIDQALAFLGACALNPGSRLVPSKQVDAGWHAFILHTREYTEFCERVAGRFIHHRPSEPGEDERGPSAIGDTVAAIRGAGFTVDPDLWTASGKCHGDDCSQCYQGCADDPRGI